ncbi:amidohydrolase family protein [Caballeronia insecticola]|uniref:Amidohydrolase 2 n=1 Tax=Caballeronia insecticola TaxID=758793 RepID=R4X3W9_9BURK|nr:amidohydrolase family protein [Caballeronia insecticola]BAN27736.1 amidohydrolase 2 [Caballeronia insecticola]
MKLKDIAPDDIPIIDAHHHLWDLSAGRYPWLQDEYHEAFFLGDYRSICRDFLPDDYLATVRAQPVIGTVHVEAERARDEQIAETRWLHEVHELYGFPGAVVAHAWFDRPDTEEILAGHAAYPLVRGIRSKPVTSSRPGESVRGLRGTMQDPAWLEGFSLLARFGFSWDLRVPPWYLAEAADVARMFPGTPIALNHTGFPWDRSAEGLAQWRRGMEQLARQPNVFVKLSEFGLKDAPWNADDNRQIVLDAVSIFGVERCMFASNFPVAGLRVSYDVLIDSMKKMLEPLGRDALEKVFYRNALQFYRVVI